MNLRVCAGSPVGQADDRLTSQNATPRTQGVRTQRHFQLLDDAIKKGDTEAVKQMILSGINVHASQDHLGYKNTALHTSARYGRGDITDLLVSAGSNVNAVDEVILVRCHQLICVLSETTLDSHR